MTQDNIFEQAAQITKAHAYDILVEQVKELQEDKKILLALLNECYDDYSNQRFTDRHGMAARIKLAIKKVNQIKKP